jgi:hypothetical protein
MPDSLPPATDPDRQSDVELPTLPTLARQWLSACQAVDRMETDDVSDIADKAIRNMCDIGYEICDRPETTAACTALKLCIEIHSLRVLYDDNNARWDQASKVIEDHCLPILRKSFGEDFELSFLFRWWRDRGAFA